MRISRELASVILGYLRIKYRRYHVITKRRDDDLVRVISRVIIETNLHLHCND